MNSAYLCPALFAALGRDEYHTVSASDSEDRRGCRILEDCDVVNLIGIHLEERPFDSVH